MAPNRRKGASKAAVAAAARRQWKVGDLVLAKVKGFPAWPATVSEPEKWGYSTDWKKVLVYFFGTQQIAFCNPADVEAFTEEKKESLLGKRHGKGADFVRAVREITDSFEKLKKQEQGNNIHSSYEVTVTNASISVESLVDSEVKEESPTAIVEIGQKGSDSTTGKGDLGFPIEDAAASTPKDSLHDKGMSSENLTGNTLVTERPLTTTYSRKKSGGILAQNFATQKRAPSARRSRPSSRVESRKFQRFITPSNSGKSVGNAAAYGLRDVSDRRGKRLRKSHDASEVHVMESPRIFANGSLEENDSEIVTVDSDNLSFNEGSTVESGYNLLQPESVVEYCEGDVVLSQRLDFQSNAVIVKKKRKPSRKRTSNNGTAELTCRLDKEAVMETKMHEPGHISPCGLKKLNESCAKDDGDEHLPLVKRARVRMGRPSSGGEEVDASVQLDDKSAEVMNRHVGRDFTALNCEEDGPVDTNSSVKEGIDNSALLNKCSMNKAPLWEVKKQFSCSVDGEAALPPSKRLHRALEAMSANAAEDGQQTSEAPSFMKASINESCFSLTRDCSNLSRENNARIVDSSNKIPSQDCTFGLSTASNPLVGEESSIPFEVAGCNMPAKSNNNLNLSPCEDVQEKDVDCVDGKNPCLSSLGTSSGETLVQSEVPKPPSCSSPVLGNKEGDVGSNHGLVGLILPSTVNCKTETSESMKPCQEDDPSELSSKNTDSVSGNVDTGSAQDEDTNLFPHVSQNSPETNKLEVTMDVVNQDSIMCCLKDTKSTLKDVKAIAFPTIEEVISADVQEPHLSLSTSLSEDRMSHKTLSGIRSSSSPVDGYSTARTSPRNTSDNSIFRGNNGCCSPDVHLPHLKSKHGGKTSNRAEAKAALTSFEVILGTLSRTKESIGRATRIAIDCAKFGVAAKVVEILIRNLESEPSLHKRVDLFFLVDSITQCSRGLKGDIGGIYPSAIQAILPRLLLAAAPPGSSAQENRRQCLKVLRLWEERRVLPELIIRRHIRDLDSFSSSSSSGAISRRLLRTERAFDDPLREVEGMVDEYGSNSSFQLPGFRMPPMLKDEGEGSDSDGESFEAVTPEHNPETPDGGKTTISVNEKRGHILEDVDGELEMEDVAPSYGAEMTTNSYVGGVNTSETLHHQFEQYFPLPFAPPLPKDVPPSSPPLPTSPPPLPSLPPPPPRLSLPPPPPANPELTSNFLDSKVYVGGIHISQDIKQPSIGQSSVAPKFSTVISDAHYLQAPEARDHQLPMHVPDSTNTCSFGSLPVSHPTIQAGNGVRQGDGATSHYKAFHLRPPHPAPSNQFSYVQSDQRVQERREVPHQSYPSSFHFVQKTDNGNFYSDHDRMKLAPHDSCETWRPSAPSLSGPCYLDSGRMSYAHLPYAGQPGESAIPNHNWTFPPRPMNHREFIPHRPPSEGPIPVTGPNFWRPR